MIKFGIRQSFDRIEQVEDRYANLSVPVEVALPYYWDIYDPVRGHLAEIADFAKALGVRTITLHPNNVNKDEGVQEKALKNLEYFTGLYNGEIVFCIETFEGKRRVFTPDETVSFNLPMTLDTSHIRDNEKIWSLLKGCKQSIKNVHLSAKERSRQHLPIDSFCKEVVSYLIENKWEGNVILEYLFEFHGQMLTDLESLKSNTEED